jgi:STE24 endopeptidase
MLEYHVAFLLLLVGTEAFFSGLSILNYRYGAATVAARSEWVRDRLGVEDPDELLGYQRATTGLSLVRTWASLGVTLLVLYSGLFADAVDAVAGLGLPPLAAGVVFFVSLVVLAQVAGAPFDLYSTFVVEELFGFNQQSPRLWLRDKLVGTAVGAVIAAVVAAAVLFVIGALPDLWWLAALALFVAFSLSMLVIYPRVIAPLFYDFDPIEEGELAEAVDDVFERAGFTCDQTYVMDASSRSSHANAYFVGFGAAKRVVLFDTLVEQTGIEEIKGVLAHELAHWKKSHIWKQLLSQTVRMGVVFALLWWLLDQPFLYEMFGVAETSYAGLLLAVLWISPLLRWSAPIENKLSLAHEREADSFAIDVMGAGKPLADALADLTSENLSNPFPHPLYATFHYTHPPVPERIRYIEEWGGDAAEEGEAAGGRPA